MLPPALVPDNNDKAHLDDSDDGVKVAEAASGSDIGSGSVEGPVEEQQQQQQPKGRNKQPKDMQAVSRRGGGGRGGGGSAAAARAEMLLPSSRSGVGLTQQQAGNAAADLTAATEVSRQQLPKGIVAQHAKAAMMWECQVCGEVRAHPLRLRWGESLGCFLGFLVCASAPQGSGAAGGHSPFKQIWVLDLCTGSGC